mgnify:CR=1 FL=1
MCIFNIHDNKETNILFLFLLKKHFLLLILFLNYYKMNKKCVENILIIFEKENIYAKSRHTS